MPKVKITLLFLILSSLLLASCGAENSADNIEIEPELAAPVILDYMIPAGEIEIGELAIILLENPMEWEMVNNSPDVVELQNATDDGVMQTSFGVIGLKLGSANLYAEKDGLGQSFTIEVVEQKSTKTLQIADSDFSLTLPSFLANKIEFVIEKGETAAELEAYNASYIYYIAETGQQIFGSFAWVLPVAKWEEIQNPNEPPLGDEMLRIGDRVLIVSGPQDLPFNDRYSNDANRYSALATLLNLPETYSQNR